MTPTAKNYDLFYHALAIATIVAPMLLVVAAGSLPEDAMQRGAFIVYGLGVELAGLTFALIMRAAYALGVSKALKSIHVAKRDAHPYGEALGT